MLNPIVSSRRNGDPCHDSQLVQYFACSKHVYRLWLVIPVCFWILGIFDASLYPKCWL